MYKYLSLHLTFYSSNLFIKMCLFLFVRNYYFSYVSSDFPMIPSQQILQVICKFIMYFNMIYLIYFNIFVNCRSTIIVIDLNYVT
ncbi:unnamed protein product [Chrysodeixis includens]|uniref:Uncharacterized protein n=1 Tax=Chrysodeixis includens TaxID=689277 RepID=A0A9N8PZ04_CHRIL|nr:unnamed protein product [Chrysodeixis includens]